MPDMVRPEGFSLEDAVLDIGGEIGALILYTDAAYNEREIEVSRLDESQAEPDEQKHEHEHEHEHLHDQGHSHDHDHDRVRRIHTAIHVRRAGGTVTYAGIYPELAAGRYRIWTDDPSLPNEVTIVGGEVAEVDWRTPAS